MCLVWVAVWRDTIRYWVLNAREVEQNLYYSRGQRRGNVGEGQLHVKQDNIQAFTPHETTGRNLLTAIKHAYQKIDTSPSST